MRTGCSYVAALFGKAWGYMGWLLFGCALLLPYATGGDESASVVFALAGLLLLLWWIIDAVDQCVSWWVYVVGMAMLALGCLSAILSIAAWVLYWMKVRE